MRVVLVVAFFAMMCGCVGSQPAQQPGEPLPPPDQGHSGDTSDSGDSPELQKAEAARDKNDWPNTKRWATEALTKQPKNPVAHLYLAMAEENLDRKSEAEKHYREALKLAPDLAPAAVNLSAMLYELKKFDDAVAVLKPMIARTKDTKALQELHQNLGWALAGLGDHNGASEQFLLAIKRGATGADLKAKVGEELLLAGKRSEAAEPLKSALAGAGNDLEMLAMLAKLLAEAGAYTECAQAASKVIEKNPTAELLVVRGRCRRKLPDYEGARSDFEASLKKKGEVPEPYVYMGDVLEKMQKPAEAKKAYTKALSLRSAATEPDAADLLKFAEKRLAELK